MGLFNHFPHTNFHELNLDWIIREVKRLSDGVGSFLEQVEEFNRRLTSVEGEVGALPEVAAQAGKEAAEAAVGPAVNAAVPPAVDAAIKDNVGPIVDDKVAEALSKYTPPLPKLYSAHITGAWSAGSGKWTKSVTCAGVKAASHYGALSYKKTGDPAADTKAAEAFGIIEAGFQVPANGSVNFTVYSDPAGIDLTVYFGEVAET